MQAGIRNHDGNWNYDIFTSDFNINTKYVGAGCGRYCNDVIFFIKLSTIIVLLKEKISAKSLHNF